MGKENFTATDFAADFASSLQKKHVGMKDLYEDNPYESLYGPMAIRFASEEEREYLIRLDSAFGRMEEATKKPIDRIIEEGMED